MAVITQIKQNVKNKNKVSVFADGEFLCSVTMDSILKCHVQVGDEADGDALKNALFASDVSTAFQKAVDWICRAPKTKAQAQKYLAGKGFSADVITAATAKLEEYRYIDDGEYARIYSEFYCNTKGKKRIAYELKAKGVADDHIEEAQEAIGDQTEAALSVAQKYMRSKQATKENLQKLFRYLAGRGFDFDVCRECIKSFSQEVLDED